MKPTADSLILLFALGVTTAGAQSGASAGVTAGAAKLSDTRSEQALTGVVQLQPRGVAHPLGASRAGARLGSGERPRGDEQRPRGRPARRRGGDGVPGGVVAERRRSTDRDPAR